MENDENTQIEENENSSEDNSKRSRIARKTAYPLPDPRMAIDKQIAILKAINIASNKGEKLVAAPDVAPLANAHPTQVSGVFGFFFKIGMFERENYKYKPKQSLIEFCNELEWDPDHAGEVLRKSLIQTWFGICITQLFRMNSELDKEGIIRALGKYAQADQFHNNALLKLVDLLEYSKIIQYDDNSKKFRYIGTKPDNFVEEPTIIEEEHSEILKEQKAVKQEQPPQNIKLATDKSNYGSEGRTNFTVNIDVKITDETDPEKLAEKVKRFKELIK
jgi:hypothetical protein